MPDLLREDESVNKDRLVTSICLIMILEHKQLSLEDLINATGMDFREIRAAAQNLVNLRLVKVVPTQRSIPDFQIINESEARSYLKYMGVTSPV